MIEKIFSRFIKNCLDFTVINNRSDHDEKNESDQSDIVWAFGYDSEHLASEEQFKNSPFAISETFIYFPEHVYPFIQAQSGLFTIHHKQNDRFVPMEDITDADLLLVKIEIPADVFPTIRYQLFWGGIHHASLFPGLSGLVKKIRYQHEFLPDEGRA